MKYSESFERDFKWYLSMRNIFNFDGCFEYINSTVIITGIRNDNGKEVSKSYYPQKRFEEIYPNSEYPSKGFYVTYHKEVHSEPIVQYDKNGVSAKESFYLWDSKGQVVPTKHPNILFSLLRTKGSANFHIKLYAEDRAKGLLTKDGVKEICSEYNCPDWFLEAIELQKSKYYPQYKENPEVIHYTPEPI